MFAAAAAALIASVAFSSPAALGPIGEGNGHGLIEQPDLVSGAWLQFPGPAGERLVRIGEHGRTASIGLPAQLRGDQLRVSPLQNGWTVAIDRYLPAARAEAYCCKEIEEPEADEPGCCDDWVLAERSPHGRWLVVQTLPHTRGNRTWVSEPVEHHGRLELAWGEPYVEAVRVAAAPLGKPLATPHIARHVLARAHSESVSVSIKRGALYDVAEYGPDVTSGEPEYIAERRLYASGRLGPTHVLRSHLLYQRGTYFSEPDGSELDLYSVGDFKLLIARRAPFAHAYEHPHLIFPKAEGSPEEGVAESFNGRLLITAEAKVRPGSEREHIAAVAVSPHGIPAPARTIEPQSGSSTREFEGAIGDRGEWLVASTSYRGGPFWLHPSSPRCAYRQRKLALAGATVSAKDPALAVSIGRSGVFHVAWLDEHEQLRSASVRVRCARR
ncbi:MAG TPA: hypothetical protein VHT25_08045 [Solirubrobacteraceae bacterium]|nr:hypothetical protein [Solirubrobacteraceae bacterium]